MKQLRNAAVVALGRQKPLTNALDGLYLPCVECGAYARGLLG